VSSAFCGVGQYYEATVSWNVTHSFDGKEGYDASRDCTEIPSSPPFLESIKLQEDVRFPYAQSPSFPFVKKSFEGASEGNGSVYNDFGASRLVVRFEESRNENLGELNDLVTKHGGEIVNTVLMEGRTIAAVVEIPSEAKSTFIVETRNRGLSEYVENSIEFQTTFVPNDPKWPVQWGPKEIHADDAWDIQIGDKSILVAVVDTGIEYTHPDLTANYVALGYDWVNNDDDPVDDRGHGTHCAGIIAAEINNNIGIAGLAQVRIMAEKGLNERGIGYDDWLANAIIHATEMGANIISMSWSGDAYTRLLHEAIKYAYDAGVLLIASAGNDANEVKHYPAAYEEVVAVAATMQPPSSYSFTNYGDWVEVAAPGDNIFSTFLNSSYAYKSGTSMAAPHVAGVAALIWSQFPSVTRDWVRLRIKYTCDLTFGIIDRTINAWKAVSDAIPDHDLLVHKWQPPPFVEPRTTAGINIDVFNYGNTHEHNVVVHLLVNE